MSNGSIRAAGMWRGAAATAVIVLAGCGGGAEPPPLAVQPGAGALSASAPGELMAFLRTKLQDRSSYMRAYPGAALPGGEGVVTTVGGPGGQSDQGGPAAAAATSVDRSGTTVQEQGVDEADLIKTDGTLIHTLQHSPFGVSGQPTTRVQTHRRLADGSLQALGTTVLPFDAELAIAPQGMLLASGVARLAVLGQSQQLFWIDACGIAGCSAMTLLPGPAPRLRDRVTLDLLRTVESGPPTLTDRAEIDGRLIGSRLIGNLLYLVTQHSPQLAVEALPQQATESERAAMIAALMPADVLPSIRLNGGPAQPLVAETDCYVQPKNASLGIEITTITVIDLQAPGLERSSRCFAGGTEALYMSSSTLYLATTRQPYTIQGDMVLYSPQSSTDLHKFALDGQRIDYRGSGVVDGHLGWDWNKRSYRMSEWNGDLRVLTFTGETGWLDPAVSGPAGSVPGTPPSPATLSILRQHPVERALQQVGQLPNAQRPAPLGKPGEQVYAVRMIGDRGYVVTFRQTDPLYMLDLANPADPRTVGELQISGFSDYLFPIGQGLLLGVGKDASDTGRVAGVKVALFDVADPARPQQLGALSYGERGSQSGLDYSSHGINLFTVGATTRVALPLALQQASGTVARGMQRLEVDSAARTLKDKPLIAVGEQAASYALAADRSVQIGDHLLVFADGELSAWGW